MRCATCLLLEIVTAAVLLASSTLRAQAPEPVKFARYAHVANDGTIAFTYQDDIWLANADGSNPRRLTAHVARDIMPRFSPDGRWIAFASNRLGNNHVYVVRASGGEPRQLRPGIRATSRRCIGLQTAERWSLRVLVAPTRSGRRSMG
jgi:hypothetical protein